LKKSFLNYDKLIFFKGVLKGFDQTINLILDDSYERVFTNAGVEQVKLGVFIIRGDNVLVLLNYNF
jgi:U6 snRNA-associated Sm-like protein LSm8